MMPKIEAADDVGLFGPEDVVIHGKAKMIVSSTWASLPRP
jgi:hypothetical protein